MTQGLRKTSVARPCTAPAEPNKRPKVSARKSNPSNGRKAPTATSTPTPTEKTVRKGSVTNTRGTPSKTTTSKASRRQSEDTTVGGGNLEVGKTATARGNKGLSKSGTRSRVDSRNPRASKDVACKQLRSTGKVRPQMGTGSSQRQHEDDESGCSDVDGYENRKYGDENDEVNENEQDVVDGEPYEDEVEGNNVGDDDDDYIDEDEIDRLEEDDLEEEDDAGNEYEVEERDERNGDAVEERADGNEGQRGQKADGNAGNDGYPGSELLRDVDLENEGGREMVSDEYVLLRRLMTKLFGVLNKRMDQVDKNVQSSFKEVKDDNSELQALVMTLHTLVASKKSTAANRTDRQRRLDCRTAILDCVVKDELVQNVLEKTLTGFLGKRMYGKQFDDFPRMGALATKAMFFAMKPKDRCSKYRTESGMLHSDFRLSFVQTLMRTLQYDKMGVFNHTTSGSSSQSTDAHSDTQLKIHFPPWLKPGYVKKKHFVEVRDRRERIVPTQKSKRPKGDEIGKEDLCIHISEKVYKLVTAILHKCRDSAKHALFEDFAYLFCNWSTFGAKVSQDTMEIRWAASRANPVDFEDIPAMEPMDFTSRMDVVTHADLERNVHKANGAKLTKMIRNHQNLLLIAEHDISIRVMEDSGAPGRKKVAENLPVKRLTRPINLLDVACKLLSVYTGSGSNSLATTFVSCDPNSLRIAYVIAVQLRAMIDSLVVEYEKNGLTFMRTPAAYDRFAVNTLSLRELLPPTSKKKQLLNTNILVLTAEEYAKRNAGRSGDAAPAGDVAGGQVDDHESDEEIDDDDDVFDV